MMRSFASKLAQKHPCPKCGGSGYIRAYDHVADGKCYRCDGLGVCRTKKEQARALELEAERERKEAKAKEAAVLALADEIHAEMGDSDDFLAQLMACDAAVDEAQRRIESGEGGKA